MEYSCYSLSLVIWLVLFKAKIHVIDLLFFMLIAVFLFNYVIHWRMEDEDDEREVSINNKDFRQLVIVTQVTSSKYLNLIEGQLLISLNRSSTHKANNYAIWYYYYMFGDHYVPFLSIDVNTVRIIKQPWQRS